MRNRWAGRRDLLYQRSDVLRIDQRVIDRGDLVLPNERFGRHFWSEIPRARTHVTVRQIERGACERVREKIRILEEVPR